MKNEEIKKEAELMYAQINKAHERLKELRSICKHENTFEGNWSWRPGSIIPATICSDCGECIKTHFPTMEDYDAAVKNMIDEDNK